MKLEHPLPPPPPNVRSHPGNGLTAVAAEAPRGADVAIDAVPAAGLDAAVLFAGRKGAALAGLATQSLLAYALLPEGRGAYAICVVFSGLLGLLLTPGAHTGMQYFVATGRVSVSQGVSLALAICLAGSAAAALLSAPLIGEGAAFFRQADASSFYLALCLIPLQAFAVAFEYQLIGIGRFGQLALLLLLRASANVAAIAVLVWGLGFGVNGAIAAFGLGHLAVIAAALGYLRARHGLRPEAPSRAALEAVVAYGLRYHAARLGAAFEPRVGVFYLGVVAGRADIGIFAVAITLMLQFSTISNAAGSSLLPRIAGRTGERSELVALGMRLALWATAAALAVWLAISAPVVRVLLSEAFEPVTPLMWIMAPGMLAYAVSSVSMTWFVGSNRPDVCSRAVAAGLAVNLGALFVLYPRIGPEAAAWAMTLSQFVRCAFLVIPFRASTGVPWAALCAPQRGDRAYLAATMRGALRPATWRSLVRA